MNTKKITLCGCLTAIALAIFVIEAQIPLPIQLPGFKLGLANVIGLLSLLLLTPKEAFLILIARIFLGAMFTGNVSVLVYSFSGGIFALLAEILLLKAIGKKFIVEISIIGAIVHNIIQVICAVLVTKTLSVFYYIPPLLIVGIFTGAFCGFCVLFAYKKINNLLNKKRN